jgi:fluoride ion exporter CrcB/FEX
VEAYGLLATGHAVVALAYAVGSVLLGVAMVVVGRALGAAAFGAAPLDLREDEVL